MINYEWNQDLLNWQEGTPSTVPVIRAYDWETSSDEPPFMAYIAIPKTGTSSIFEQLAMPKVCTSRHQTRHVPAVATLDHNHDHSLITFIREPFQLYCSFYIFMKWRIDNGFIGSPMQMFHANTENVALIQSGATLEEFLLQCPVGQFYPYFVNPLTAQDFDFIGNIDRFEESIVAFNAMFNLSLDVVHYNKGQQDSPYVVSDEVVAAFKSRQSEEYVVYNDLLLASNLMLEN